MLVCPFSFGRNDFAPAKPLGQVLKRCLQLVFVSLDLAKASLERDPPYSLCFAGLGGFKLLLQFGDFVADFSRSASSFQMVPCLSFRLRTFVRFLQTDLPIYRH